jgi:MFS family permease
MFFPKLKLKSRNIDIIFIKSLIGGLMFFLPILALYYEKTLFSLINVAIILAVNEICLVIFEVPTGSIADLFGRRKTIIVSRILKLFALIFLFIGGNMFMFIIYAIINSLAKSLNSGTGEALLYDTLKNEKQEKYYKKGIGITHALWSTGAAIGSIVGGYLATISLTLPILITFIPYSIVLVLTFFIKEPQYEKENHKNVFKHIINSLKTVIKNKQVILLFIVGLLFFAFSDTIHQFKPIFYEFKNLPLPYFGYLAALIFGLSALGYLISHDLSEKIGNKKTLILSVIFSAIFIILSTLTNGIYSGILIALPSFAYGLYIPVLKHLINIETTSSKRATIMSMLSLATHLGVAIFAPVIGYLAGLYSINIAFRISGLLLFATSFVYLLLKNKK